MKKLLLSALVLGLATLTNAQTWTLQTSGSSDQLNAISFVDANNGYAAGDNQTLIKTTNGGSNWTAVTTPTIGIPLTFSSIHFINATTGWVLSDIGILFFTTNSGSFWSIGDLTALPSGVNWEKVHFGDANNGYLTGTLSGSMVLAKTIDGGANWSTLTYTGSATYASGLQAIGADSVILAVGNKVWYSSNAGTSWTLSSTISTGSNLGQLKAFSFNDAYCPNGTNSNNIVYKTNAFPVWNQTIGTGLAGGGYNFIDGFNKNNILVAKFDGTVYCTTDGGINWAVENVGSALIAAVSYPVSGSAWVLGKNGAIHKMSTTTSNIKNNTETKQLSIFPNPAQNNISINASTTLNKISVTDVLGIIVLTKTSDNNSESIDLSNLQSGVYFITANGVVKKIVKE